MKTILLLTIVLACTSAYVLPVNEKKSTSSNQLVNTNFAWTIQDLETLTGSTGANQNPQLAATVIGSAVSQVYDAVPSSLEYLKSADAEDYVARRAFIDLNWPKVFTADLWKHLSEFKAFSPLPNVDGGDQSTANKAKALVEIGNFIKCMNQPEFAGYAAHADSVVHPKCVDLELIPQENLFEFVQALGNCYNACSGELPTSATQITHATDATTENVPTKAEFDSIVLGHVDKRGSITLITTGGNNQLPFVAGPLTWVNYRIYEVTAQSSYLERSTCQSVCQLQHDAQATFAERNTRSVFQSLHNKCMTENKLDTNAWGYQMFDEETLLETNILDEDRDLDIPFECYLFRKESRGSRMWNTFEGDYWYNMETCSNYCMDHLDLNNADRTYLKWTELVTCNDACDTTYKTANGYTTPARSGDFIIEPVDDGEGATLLTATVALLAFVMLLL